MSDTARDDEQRALSDENIVRHEEEEMHDETGDPGHDREHLQGLAPADAADDGADPDPTPPGGAGADSGAASVVEVEGRSARAGSTERSSQNDIPGVGPRGPEREGADD